MIRIFRSSNIPVKLTGVGVAEKNKTCQLHDDDIPSYRLGNKKLPPAKKEIYGSASVRKSLKKCQHNKCCYSEAKFNRDSIHVEHYRPKAALGMLGSNKKTYPGYYWLAYEWSNLMLCKAGINSDKKDLFPLVKGKRAINHTSDLALEYPLIIDPTSEDPRKHIRFHKEQPFGLTRRGAFTVELLLNHPELDEDRRRYYQTLLIMKNSLQKFNEIGLGESDLAAELREALANAIKPDAEYSSMAIDLMKK